MDTIKTWLQRYTWWWLPLDVYVLGVGGYFLLRLLTGYAWWPIDLTSEGLHLVLPFSVVLLPIALAVRDWVRGGLVGVIVVIFAVLYGPQLVRGVAGSDAACEDCLTVMTYNIGNGIIPEEELVGYLSASGADIIGLQEVVEDDVATLEGIEAYPYKAVYSHPGGLGRAVLSQYPIVEEEMRLVHGEDNAKYLITTLDVEGEAVTVIVTRFKTPRYGVYPGTRGRTFKTWPNAQTIAQELQTRQTTTILLVDMNASAQSENMRMLKRAGYVDAYQRGGAGYGLTFPARTDAWRDLPDWIPAVIGIDHVMVTDDVQVVSAWVDTSMRASDHYPLFANLSVSR